MDISKWPLEEIMQLPDHAFGRRWIVTVGTVALNSNTLYDISEAGLPENCVVWEIMWCADGVPGFTVGAALALGDVLPTTDAEFYANERFINDWGILLGVERIVFLRTYQSWRRMEMRVPIRTAGRRLIGRWVESGAVVAAGMTGITISSIPREVPDWLISGHR